MDFSKFVDDNFDVKDWVNSAFDSQKDSGSSTDQYATTLVMKLQMFIQEVNNVIEDTSLQAVHNLPRVLREVQAVKQESILLQDQMKMVKQDIQKVEQETSASMQILLDIDSIKTRMQATSSALKEADNWTTLSADIENVFQSQDLQMITAKLSGMQQSLLMLKDVPDYTERCQHLEKLKDRLEAMLGPQLVAAFNSKSTDLAQMYVKIFSDINRLTELYKYYHKCHKSHLVQAWKTIVESNAQDTLADWLSEFYDNLISEWHTQIKWTSQVFREPIQIVCTMVTEVLNSMQPSVSSCLHTYMDQTTDKLIALIEVKQISERFAKSLEGTIDAHTQGAMGWPYIQELATAIYSPYKTYFKQYGALEERRLQAELDNINMDESEILDSVRVLGESVSKLFSHAKQANERGTQFMSSCGFIGLLSAYQTYFKSYCYEFKRVLVNLREKCKEGIVDQDEWTLFQNSLRIINTCGELILHIEELDDSLMSDILHTVGRQCTPTSPHSTKKANPFHSYMNLYLDEADQSRLQDLVRRLEEDLPSVLEDVKHEFYNLSVLAHQLTFDIVFTLPQNHLRELSRMEIWTSKSSGGALTTDLPTFSLSPQEYITQIGQYLMTLPQHLEPYTSQENPALLVALKYGKLPYIQQQETIEHIADVWLESVAKGTMHVYIDEVMAVNTLTPHACKQLVTDISYFINVLDDLGLQPSQTMSNLHELLKSSPEQLDRAGETIDEQLVGKIRRMRGIDDL